MSDAEYARIAKIWQDNIRAYPFRTKVMYPNIIEGLYVKRRKSRVLDLACGTGYLTHKISKHARVCGVDRSAQMIAQAQQLYPNTSFVRADMGSLPFLDHSIDAIAASCSYHYAQDLSQLYQMLAESSRVLRRGGRISGVLASPWRPVVNWVSGSVRSSQWLDEPFQTGSRISIGVHDPETGKLLDAFTVYYYTDSDYKEAFDVVGLALHWEFYRPSKKFMQRSDAKRLEAAMQVELFSALKR